MLEGPWGVCEVLSGPHPCGPPEMPPDAACSKVLIGISSSVLGFVFLALGLGFYLHKNVRRGPGGCVPLPSKRVCSPWNPQSRANPFSLSTELLSWPGLQPLPMASGSAGTPVSIPTLILGELCVPPALLSLCPCPAAPSVPNNPSQFAPVPFTGGQWGEIWRNPGGIL